MLMGLRVRPAKRGDVMEDTEQKLTPFHHLALKAQKHSSTVIFNDAEPSSNRFRLFCQKLSTLTDSMRHPQHLAQVRTR